MFNKTLLIAALTNVTLISASNADADLLAYYGDGSLADAAAEANLATPPANASVSDIDSFGVIAGTTGNPTGGDTGRITRNGFNTPTPVGPTAGSASGTEWFEARSRENQGAPTSTDNYFFFTVDADTGFALDLTSLKFDFWLSNGGGGDMDADAEAFVAVDGGSFVSVGSINATDTLGVGVSAPVSTADFDLSSITGAESIEVRIGIGYTSGVADSQSGFVQGIQLEGDVVVIPEPSSLALIGLGGLMIARRRRSA